MPEPFTWRAGATPDAHEEVARAKDDQRPRHHREEAADTYGDEAEQRVGDGLEDDEEAGQPDDLGTPLERHALPFERRGGGDLADVVRQQAVDTAAVEVRPCMRAVCSLGACEAPEHVELERLH